MDFAQTVFRYVELDFPVAGLDDRRHRRAGGHDLAHFAGQGRNTAVVVGHELRVAHLVLCLGQVCLGAAERRFGRFVLGLVLVARHGADGAFFKQGCIAGVVVPGQLVVRLGRVVGGLGRVQGLAYVLRVDFHEHLAGADRIAYIDVAADDFAGYLEGQAAFVFTAHRAGIDGLVVRRGFADGDGAHHGNHALVLDVREQGGVHAPEDEQYDDDPQYDIMSTGQFDRRKFHGSSFSFPVSSDRR